VIPVEIMLRHRAVECYLRHRPELAIHGMWRQAHVDRGILLGVLERFRAVDEMRERVETALYSLARVVPVEGQEKPLGDVACVLLGALQLEHRR